MDQAIVFIFLAGIVRVFRIKLLRISTKPFNLVSTLLRRVKEHEFVIFGDRSYLEELTGNSTCKARLSLFSDWAALGRLFAFPLRQLGPLSHQIRLSLELLCHKPDIFFSPATVFPLHCPCKGVATVHDLTPILFKEFFTFRQRLRSLQRLSSGIKHAHQIIAVSQATKNDILKHFKVEPDKISVIYEGVDLKLYKPEDNPLRTEEVKQKYNLEGKYILYVGNLEPRKNVPRLIEAFSLLRKKDQISHKLVIVGKKAWLYEEIFHTVKRLGLEREIVFTGYVPQSELPILMSGADIFVYPSLYEGFGLPPLEAMACGTPVITSNISSLPEVVGDAGILVDPYRIEEISKAIYQIISNEQLKQKLRQRGLRRARMFSWEKAAEATLKVFEEIHSHD